MTFKRYSFLVSFVATGCGGQVAPATVELSPTGAVAGSQGSGPRETTLGGSTPLNPDPAPRPPLDCDGTTCDSSAECVLDACVPQVRNCNRSQVYCGEPRQTCPPGKTASVTNGCWGECVDISACGNLESCDVCAENKIPCVEWQGESQSAFGCRVPTCALFKTASVSAICAKGTCAPMPAWTSRERCESPAPAHRTS